MHTFLDYVYANALNGHAQFKQRLGMKNKTDNVDQNADDHVTSLSRTLLAQNRRRS